MNAVTPAFAAPFDIEAHNAAAARRSAFILGRPVCEGQAALTVRDMPATEADIVHLMHARLGAAISDLRSLATYLTGSTRQHADGLVSDLDESGFALLAEDVEQEARDDWDFAAGQDRHDAGRIRMSDTQGKTTMTISIRSRWGSKRVVFEGNFRTVREAVIDAIRSDTDLRDTDLSGADLSGANLSGANLSRADLSRADLRGADLSRADLRDTDLSGADLRRTNLSDTDLRRTNLQSVKQDLIAEVLRLPNELDALRDALVNGRIDGSSYSGECACLAGTLAAARGISDYDGDLIVSGPVTFHASVHTPREQWFLGIKVGDTPESNQIAALALEWVEEAIAIRDHIRATAPGAAA